MNVIAKIRKTFYRIKHNCRRKNRNYYSINDIKILQDKIFSINESISLGTSTWENFRREIRTKILEGYLSDFLNWNVIQQSMFHEANEIEYLEVMKNPLLSISVKESNVGNPKPYFLDNSTSGNLIHNAYSVVKLFNKLKDPQKELKRIIEFGGGYGSMCRLFRNMEFSGKYIIFDLPEFSALQKFYLNSINTKYIKNTIFAGKEDMNKYSNDSLGTLFIATWSFSEMPLELREEILNNLKFNYCIIAFQNQFDGIDNLKYFNNFIKKYKNINFDLSPIKHLEGNYYLIGTKK